MKFQRCMVSEIIGLDAVPGRKTSSRIDPAQIRRDAGPVYRTSDGSWTLDQAAAGEGSSRGVRPSDINHGNIPPSISDGGFTISRALQTTVLSLPALRRLRFPIDGAATDPQVDLAAQTALAALALLAATLTQEQGADLRSRCPPVSRGTRSMGTAGSSGQRAQPVRLPWRAGQGGLPASGGRRPGPQAFPWLDQELVLQPSRQLQALVQQSQVLAAGMPADGGEDQ